MMTLITIEDLPIEILEIIFSMLPSVVDQISLSVVCHNWRQIVLNLRHFYRNHLRKHRLKCNKTNTNLHTYTFDRHVYTRLPVAGSLNDWGEYL